MPLATAPEAPEDGARLFICRDGENMAPAVAGKLRQIYLDATGATDEQVDTFADQVVRDGRYLADLFR